MPLIDTEGRFRAKVTGKELCRASTGTEQIAVGFEVTAEGPQKGHHITWYGFLTEAALAKTVERLRVLGWQGVDLADISTVGSSGDVEITVKPDEYNGKTTLKVAFIDPLGSVGGGVKDVLNEADKKAFAAKMRAKIVGLDPKRAQTQKPAAQPSRQEPPAHLNDPDIPF